MTKRFNYNSMISIASMLLIVIAISSCAEIEIDENTVDTPELRIIPNIKGGIISTKSINQSNNNTIGISTYTISNNNSVAKEYFTDSLFNYGSGWSIGNSRNWPVSTIGNNSTEKLSIFAVSPASIKIDDADYISTSGEILPSFSFKVNHSVSKQENVITSSVTTDYNSSTSGAVGMKFNSILSNIDIKLKGNALSNANTVYTIKSIKMIGKVSDQGTYYFSGNTIVAENSSYNTYEFPIDNTEWNSESNPESWTERTISIEESYSNNSYENISMKMIPQDLTGKNVSIDIEYSVSVNGIIVFDGTHVTDIYGVWDQGKSYTYYISLPNYAQEITFSPTVVGWNE